MNKSYDIKWQRDDDKITISKSFYEHLLNCLANQKFIGESPTCGDGLAECPEKVRNIQAENQKAINKAWREGMFILSIDVHSDKEYEKIVNKLVEYKTKNLDKDKADCSADMEEYKSDENIQFKWWHLFNQEVLMWARIGCTSDAIIDCENEKYEVGQVALDDFNEIVKIRGFTPRMISSMREVLKEIGIGNNL